MALKGEFLHKQFCNDFSTKLPHKLRTIRWQFHVISID